VSADEEAKATLANPCECRWDLAGYSAVKAEKSMLMDIVEDIPHVASKATVDCLIKEVRQLLTDICAALIKLGERS
jgi:hypothetical protein